MATILNYKDKSTSNLFKLIDNNYASKGDDRYEVTDHRLPSIVTKKYIDINTEGTEGKRHSLTWIGLDKRLPWTSSSLNGNTITYYHKSPGTYIDLEVTSYIDDHVIKEHKAYTKYAMRHIKGEYFSFNSSDIKYNLHKNYVYYKEGGRRVLNYSYYIVPPILKIKNSDGSLSTFNLDYNMSMINNRVKLTPDFLSVVQHVKDAFDLNNCQWVSVLYIIKNVITRENIDYLNDDIKSPGSRSTGVDVGLYELPETDYTFSEYNSLTKTMDKSFLFIINPSNRGIRLDNVDYRYKKTGVWVAWEPLKFFYTSHSRKELHKERDATDTIYSKVSASLVWLNTEVQIRYYDFKGDLYESNVCTILGNR